MKYRYRNICVVDETGDVPEPLYWSNTDGWVTAGYTEFTEHEIRYMRPPIDGIIEPVSEFVILECNNGCFPVEILEDVPEIKYVELDEIVDALQADPDWKPDFDEETLREALRRAGIKNYRVHGIKTVVNCV